MYILNDCVRHGLFGVTDFKILEKPGLGATSSPSMPKIPMSFRGTPRVSTTCCMTSTLEACSSALAQGWLVE